MKNIEYKNYVNSVKRPYPKDPSASVQSQSLKGFKLESSSSGVSRSSQRTNQPVASLSLGRLLYVAPSITTLILHLDMQRSIVCRGEGQVSLPVTCQVACVTQPQPDRQCDMFTSGLPLWKDLTPRVFHLQLMRKISRNRGFELVFWVRSQALLPKGQLAGCQSECRILYNILFNKCIRQSNLNPEII